MPLTWSTALQDTESAQARTQSCQLTLRLYIVPPKACILAWVSVQMRDINRTVCCCNIYRLYIYIYIYIYTAYIWLSAVMWRLLRKWTGLKQYHWLKLDLVALWWFNVIGCLKYLAIHSFPRNTRVIFSWTLNSSVQSLLLLFLDVLKTNLLFSVSHYLSEPVLKISKEYTTSG